MRLAGLEKGKLRAKYLEAAGNITNYELHAADEAVELYNQALDEDPDNLKTFERIDKIMTAKKDWKNQERAYRRMIKRLGQEVPPEKRQTQVALWHALGEIYRSRLKDFKAATAGLRGLRRAGARALPRHQILAELYQLPGPELYEKAIAEYRHHHQARRRTSAQMAVAAEDAAASCYMDLQPVRPRLVRGLGAGLPAQGRSRGAALLRAVQAEGLRAGQGAAHRGAVAEEHLPPGRGPLHLARLRGGQPGRWRRSRPASTRTGASSARTGATRPTTSCCSARCSTTSARCWACRSRSCTCGPNRRASWTWRTPARRRSWCRRSWSASTLLQGRPEKELAYVVGKKLTLMRPDHFVRWPHVVPTVGELKVVFLAALKLAQPKFRSNPSCRQPVASTCDSFASWCRRSCSSSWGWWCSGSSPPRPRPTSASWSNAVDYTATRAGYLMCNDLDVAARLAQAEPVSVGSAEPKDKIRDLVQWTISDEYFALREHLGLDDRPGVNSDRRSGGTRRRVLAWAVLALRCRRRRASRSGDGTAARRRAGVRRRRQVVAVGDRAGAEAERTRCSAAAEVDAREQGRARAAASESSALTREAELEARARRSKPRGARGGAGCTDGGGDRQRMKARAARAQRWRSRRTAAGRRRAPGPWNVRAAWSERPGKQPRQQPCAIAAEAEVEDGAGAGSRALVRHALPRSDRRRASGTRPSGSWASPSGGSRATTSPSGCTPIVASGADAGSGGRRIDPTTPICRPSARRPAEPHALRDGGTPCASRGSTAWGARWRAGRWPGLGRRPRSGPRRPPRVAGSRETSPPAVDREMVEPSAGALRRPGDPGGPPARSSSWWAG